MRYLVAIMFIGMMGSLISHARFDAGEAKTATHVVRPVEDAGDGPAAEVPAASNIDGGIQLDRGPDGHFYADVDINGATVTMLVDTGASGIALSREDARKAGIATSIGMNDVVGRGADGSVHGEFITIDRISLGEKRAEQMPALVLNNGEQSLLGQSFLQKFASVEIRGDTMTLR